MSDQTFTIWNTDACSSQNCQETNTKNPKTCSCFCPHQISVIITQEKYSYTSSKTRMNGLKSDK